MTNEELNETITELMVVADSLRFHQVSADAVYSISSFNRERFCYHAKDYMDIAVETLKNDINFLEKIINRLQKARDNYDR
ncbi:hypothetical protein [Streptococcus cuniculi]|uniref:Uncharacterized protein n=1 Tax=Streptococcus cuniculi TaxID=1432788 RepID=A0A4Y9JAJ3_9STRE|nr:hypothetical protein [Streptococcus cuniculi]MBF0778335.1 hypothetical protein [Streptococcus cuniculi]TFU97827.1 hypothetical protein E4T82_06285 [Streptococcus cuniculi]